MITASVMKGLRDGPDQRSHLSEKIPGLSKQEHFVYVLALDFVSINCMKS